MSAEIDRILAEQRACADQLAKGLPDSGGARAGLHHWIAEEVLIRLEEIEAE